MAWTRLLQCTLPVLPSNFKPTPYYPTPFSFPVSKPVKFRVKCTKNNKASDSNEAIECIGTGSDAQCFVESNAMSENVELLTNDGGGDGDGDGVLSLRSVWETAVLISPFFFWGTAMVAMKEVIPKMGPLSVAAFRLLPAGMLLIGFASVKGRPMPSGFYAWLSISLFALVDATAFQGFLAEGLQKTAAGLGSVIIDSQPLTVAVLAAVFFGESIGYIGAGGLVLGVVGLLLLELPAISNDGSEFSLWGSGESLMLLSAQSMAIGTVMVRWVSKYSDPVMATGWHMLLGGIPLAVVSVLNNDPIYNGGLKELSAGDFSALFYTSIFGSAISYGVFFYNATQGSLTKLSSLTFLTPMFASIFGFLYLGESFTNVQLVGAFITLVAIYLVNY